MKYYLFRVRFVVLNIYRHYTAINEDNFKIKNANMNLTFYYIVK